MPTTDVCGLIDACAAELAAAMNHDATTSPAFPLACLFMGFKDNECQNEVSITLGTCWGVDPAMLPVVAERPGKPYTNREIETLVWDECRGTKGFSAGSGANTAILAYFVDLNCDDDTFAGITRHFAALPQPLGVRCRHLVFAFAHAAGVAADWERCGRHFKQLADIQAHTTPFTLVCFADMTTKGPLSKTSVHENYQAAAALVYVADCRANEGGEGLRQALFANRLLCVAFKASGTNCRTLASTWLSSYIQPWVQDGRQGNRPLGFNEAAARLGKDTWASYLFSLWDKEFGARLHDESGTLFTVPYTAQVAELDACFSEKRGLFGSARSLDYGKIQDCTDEAVASLSGSKGVWELLLERYYQGPASEMFRRADNGAPGFLAGKLEASVREKLLLGETVQLLVQPGEERRRCFEELRAALVEMASRRYAQAIGSCADLGSCLDIRARYDLERGYVAEMLSGMLEESLSRLSRWATSLNRELEYVSKELRRMDDGDQAVRGVPPMAHADSRGFVGLSADGLQNRLEDAFREALPDLVGMVPQQHRDDLAVARELLNHWDGCVNDIRLPLTQAPYDRFCPDSACVLRSHKSDDDRMTVVTPWCDRVEYLAVLPLEADDIDW